MNKYNFSNFEKKCPPKFLISCRNNQQVYMMPTTLLSGEPDYFGRNKISSGGDLSHYSSASLY